MNDDFLREWHAERELEEKTNWASLRWSLVTGGEPTGHVLAVKFAPASCIAFFVGSSAPGTVQGLLENPTFTGGLYYGTPFQAKQENRKLRLVTTGIFPTLGWLVLDSGRAVVGQKVAAHMRNMAMLLSVPAELLIEQNA